MPNAVAKASAKVEYTWASTRAREDFLNSCAGRSDAHECDVVMKFLRRSAEELRHNLDVSSMFSFQEEQELTTSKAWIRRFLSDQGRYESDTPVENA